jgi:hypothetical protein
MIFGLYIVPVILSYLYARSLIIEENYKADIKDVFMVFTPVINLILGIFYIFFIIEGVLHTKKGTTFINLFFLIDRKK